MKKLAKAMEPEEFPLQARRAVIIDIAATEQPEAEQEPSASAKATPIAVADRDFLSSVSEMLAESGRLARLAEEVKPAGTQDDEFGRFVRDAVHFIDALDRIVELGREQDRSEELQGWFRSVEALHQRVIRLFENYGLKMISCVGQEVDFGFQDVIEYRRTKDYPHNTVIQELRKGIIFRGQSLRDAKVVVACNQ